MSIVVVGAGIVGASVAYHAARAGADVVLLDAAPMPAAGVTGSSFAWIGGPGGADATDGSTLLRRSVIDDYRRLERELPGMRVRWCGSLAWGVNRPDADRLGPDERLVDAAGVARLEPRLRLPPELAVWRPTDAAVDAVAVTGALVSAARAFGTQVRFDAAVTGLLLDAGKVVGVDTLHGPVDAETVVLTAGTGVPALCAPLGVEVPVGSSPAVLIRFAAPRGLVRGIVATPEIEVREATDGGLLVAAEYAGETSEAELRRSAMVMLQRLQGVIDGAEQAELVDVRVGLRPMPADGLPIVGPLPGVRGLYLAVMHSGVTLAPVVGRLVARELVDGERVPELAGVRIAVPGRFPSPPARRV